MQRFSFPANFKPYFWLIKFIGVIVPQRLRFDWRQEWESELRWRELQLLEWEKLNWKSKLNLLQRSTSAFWDALWLQPKRLEDDMWQDLRFGVRMLLKAPGFTLSAVLSLTIGIGATSAIFSVVNGVVLRPLPFRQPEQLVRLWHNRPAANFNQVPVSADQINVWRERAKSFDGVAAFTRTSSVLTIDREPEEVRGARISSNLFSLLGIQPFLGRGFLPEENRRGKERVIVLSHQLWQRRFGSDPEVIERTLTLDHKYQYTVIGVMPEDFNFPDQSEFWTPETVVADNRADMRSLQAIARLKPGVTSQSAATEIASIHRQLQHENQADYKNWEVELQPLHNSIIGKVRNSLLILLGAVGFVLLIACANVANLLLARAASRQKEMAMRAALGAGRLRLLRQLLTESALLAVLGGGLGLLVASWAVKGLVALNPPGIPRLKQVNLDSRVLLFTFAATILSGMIFGIAPAWHASKTNLNQALKDNVTRFSSKWRRRFFLSRHLGLREATVIAQTALAIVLLVGAGLLIKSFVKLRQVELGFTPTNAIIVSLVPPVDKFEGKPQTVEYYRRLLDSLKTLPGVESIGLMTGAPTGGVFMSSPIIIAGRPAPDNAFSQNAFVTLASPDYFRAIGNPIRQGRSFTDHDHENSPLVAIINESMAHRYFAGENPIGQRIALKGEPEKLMEIVGVAADVKQFSLEIENQPGFYQPYRQRDDVSSYNLAVRTSMDSALIIPSIRNRIREVDKDTAITGLRTLNEMVSDSIAQPRFYTLLLGIFAAIALSLAALGIYGVMAYSVNQRTHEIGVRVALGAESSQILRMFAGQGLILVLIGIAIGLGGAFALTRLMASLLFGVSVTDPTIFIGIALLLLILTLLACLIPARKATQVDPLVALRHE